MTKRKKKRSIPSDVLITGLVLVLFLTLSVASIFSNQNDNGLKEASVVRLLDLETDGGFFYQNVEAVLKDEGKFINVRIQLKDISLEKINIGNKIYVTEVESNIGEIYNFSDYKRSTTLLWILLIFFSLLVVILGKVGVKYIFATILVLILLASGLLTKILTDYNIYVASLLILVTVSFSSILVQVKNLKLASIVSISQAVTLVIILLLNIILFRLTFLIEIFYTDITFVSSNISLVEFWSIINAAVLFISFGASINTTLDVAKSVLDKKRKYPKSSTVNLIREGTQHNQLATGRVINSLFFVFLGVTLVYLLLSGRSDFATFWDDPRVVQFIILFVNSSLAAIFVGPITALISAMVLTSSENKPMQFNLRK